MKKLIILLICLVTINVLFNFCTSSFLEEKPIDRLTTENFFQSAADAESAVTGAYQSLQKIYNRDIYLLTEVSTDNCKNGIGMSNSDMQNCHLQRYSSENSFFANVWQWTYEGIARANTAIARIPGITMDNTLKNRYLGELRFLRALHYFNLVQLWGEVPLLLDEPESFQDAIVPKSPKDQIYQQIIDDLKFAEGNLPVSYPASENGRATKGAAKILLGKVYLTIHEYQNCVSKLAEVVENEASYGYGLHEYFGDNFEPDSDYGKESVFCIIHTGPPGSSNPLGMSIPGPKYSLPGGFAILGLTNCNESWIPTMDLYTQYLDEDERKEETIRTEFISLIDGSKHISSIPIFVKWWQDNQPNTAQCQINKDLIRYSDALLLYAEALNEIGQTTKAHSYLNRIRERAFNSTDFNYNGLSQLDFREAVLQERRLEFAYEGQRRFDLVRTGKFVEQIKRYAAREAELAESNKIEIANNIKDYMVVFPIPQHEIDLNDQLVQNEGY